MANENPSPGEMMQRVGFGAGIALGMGGGVALGVAFDNMALGIGFGISIGTIFMIALGVVGAKLRADEAAARRDGTASDDPETAAGSPGAASDGSATASDHTESGGATDSDAEPPAR